MRMYIMKTRREISASVFDTPSTASAPSSKPRLQVVRMPSAGSEEHADNMPGAASPHIEQVHCMHAHAAKRHWVLTA